MGKTTRTLLSIAIVFTLLFSFWMAARIVKSVQFDSNCSQYLKRAADATTIDIAKEELAKAIAYAEKNNLTQGITLVLLNQPRNDIGFWYKNLKEAYLELENLPKDATELEKTNLLMKLRGTLTDSNEFETYVIVPTGIEVYPQNVLYFWCTLISGILCYFFWLLFFIAYMRTKN